MGKGQKNRPFEHFKEAALKKVKVRRTPGATVAGGSSGNKGGFWGGVGGGGAKIITGGSSSSASAKKALAPGLRGNSSGVYSSKVATILEIWQAGLGVVSLSAFQNSISSEALTREACMIEAIGGFGRFCHRTATALQQQNLPHATETSPPNNNHTTRKQQNPTAQHYRPVQLNQRMQGTCARGRFELEW